MKRRSLVANTVRAIERARLRSDKRNMSESMQSSTERYIKELLEKTSQQMKFSMFAGIALLSAFTVVALVAYCRYGRKPRALRERHYCDICDVCCPSLPDDDFKNYDAFVSFSHHDERFVIEQLVLKLEREPLFLKLCLHYRDWDIGGFIPEQIARSIERSHKTIIVLSRGFLKSVWGRLEFRVAHTNAVRERRVRVVVVLLEDLLDANLFDEDLRTYLETDTYVKWGDPQFWEKLGQYLPRRDETKRKGIFSRRTKERTSPEQRLDVEIVPFGS